MRAGRSRVRGWPASSCPSRDAAGTASRLSGRNLGSRPLAAVRIAGAHGSLEDLLDVEAEHRSQSLHRPVRAAHPLVQGGGAAAAAWDLPLRRTVTRPKPSAVRRAIDAAGPRANLLVDAMKARETGTVWFRASGRAPDASERWAPYRPGDRFIGFVELPPDHALLAATGGMLWTTIRDEFDLPTITGWRPAWPSGPDRRD